MSAETETLEALNFTPERIVSLRAYAEASTGRVFIVQEINDCGCEVGRLLDVAPEDGIHSLAGASHQLRKHGLRRLRNWDRSVCPDSCCLVFTADWSVTL